jgi:hypothetical protein
MGAWIVGYRRQRLSDKAMVLQRIDDHDDERFPLISFEPKGD